MMSYASNKRVGETRGSCDNEYLKVAAVLVRFENFCVLMGMSEEHARK